MEDKHLFRKIGRVGNRLNVANSIEGEVVNEF